MAKCKLCGKKGLFLKLDSEGFCRECLKQKEDEKLQNAQNAYRKLSSAYAETNDFQKYIDLNDRYGKDKCITACDYFINLCENTELSQQFISIFKKNAIKRVKLYDLPDFQEHTKYGDELGDIALTISNLCENVLARKKIVLESLEYTREVVINSEITVNNKSDAEKVKDLYQKLASKYVEQKMFRKYIDSSDTHGIEKCISACDEFSELCDRTTVSAEFVKLFRERAILRYSYCELPDFDTMTSYGDTLEDISKTLSDLRETALKRKDHLCKARDDILRSTSIIDSLPRYQIQISNSVLPKRSVTEVSELVYSRITSKTPRDKLSNFVVIDTETTGLSVTSAEIIEVSAIRFRNFQPTEYFSMLCRPKKGLSDEAQKVNGITLEMVENQPLFGQIVESLQTFIGNDNLVGHNLQFDLRFLVKNGLDLTTTKRKYYDTLIIAQQTLKKPKMKWDKELYDYMPNFDADYDVEDHKLTTLCRYYGIQHIGAHRALADCYATGLLLECLAKEKETPNIK